MSEVIAETGPRRAVVLVGGPVAPYSRALRIARALAAEGYNVEIAGVAAPGLPESEPVAPPAAGSVGEPAPDPAQVGSIELRRYWPSGPWAIIGASDAATAPASTGTAPPGSTASGGPRRLGRRAIRALAVPFLMVRRWLFWPHAVRGWWATLARELAPADLYHACGTLTIAAALAARKRAPVGPSGTRSRVIYDAIDNVFESNESLGSPGLVLRRNARREAAWARAADALVSVNEPLAERLAARWNLDRRPLAVANLPEPQAPGAAGRADHLRSAAGLPATTRIVLFQGRLGRGLGLDEAAAAVLLVPDAALVLLGFGRGMAASLARDRDPRFAGRHVTLPARHPDELIPWIASADVVLIPLPPISMNQRFSTPNKFWEGLAAGTPVVVVSGLQLMERLVIEHDLGVVAASSEPVDLAAAISATLERLASDGEAWRRHIAATGRERFGWPGAAAAYRALVRGLGS